MGWGGRTRGAWGELRKGLGEYIRRGKLRERIGVEGRDACVQQSHMEISWKGPVWGVVVGALGVEGGGGVEGWELG